MENPRFQSNSALPQEGSNMNNDREQTTLNCGQVKLEKAEENGEKTFQILVEPVLNLFTQSESEDAKKQQKNRQNNANQQPDVVKQQSQGVKKLQQHKKQEQQQQVNSPLQQPLDNQNNSHNLKKNNFSIASSSNSSKEQGRETRGKRSKNNLKSSNLVTTKNNNIQAENQEQFTVLKSGEENNKNDNNIFNIDQTKMKNQFSEQDLFDPHFPQNNQLPKLQNPPQQQQQSQMESENKQAPQSLFSRQESHQFQCPKQYSQSQEIIYEPEELCDSFPTFPAEQFQCTQSLSFPPLQSQIAKGQQQLLQQQKQSNQSKGIFNNYSATIPQGQKQSRCEEKLDLRNNLFNANDLRQTHINDNSENQRINRQNSNTSCNMNTTNNEKESKNSSCIKAEEGIKVKQENVISYESSQIPSKSLPQKEKAKQMNPKQNTQQNKQQQFAGNNVNKQFQSSIGSNAQDKDSNIKAHKNDNKSRNSQQKTIAENQGNRIHPKMEKIEEENQDVRFINMIEEEPIIPIPEEQNDTCEPQNIEIEIPIEKDLISKEAQNEDKCLENNLVDMWEDEQRQEVGELIHLDNISQQQQSKGNNKLYSDENKEELEENSLPKNINSEFLENGEDGEKSMRGLRNLSLKVKEIVQEKKITTYKEVAEQLVHNFKNGIGGLPVPIYHSKEEMIKDEQNIKRRVYDALNVLIASDVIAKKGKKVQSIETTALSGKCLNTNNWEMAKTSKERLDRKKLEITNKRQMVSDYAKKFLGLQALILRNQQLEKEEFEKGELEKRLGSKKRTFQGRDTNNNPKNHHDKQLLSTDSSNSKYLLPLVAIIIDKETPNEQLLLKMSKDNTSLQVYAKRQLRTIGDLDILCIIEMHKQSEQFKHHFLCNEFFAWQDAFESKFKSLGEFDKV